MMKTTIYLTGKEEMVKDIARLVGYTGRKFSLRIAPSGTVDCSRNGFWDGGSRSIFTLIRLGDMALQSMPEHRMFGQNDPVMREVPLPVGFVVAEVSEGSYSDLQIWVGPEGTAPLLPRDQNDLTVMEKIVLFAINHFKSSYGGIKDLRFHEAATNTGITRAWYDAAKAVLFDKKFLTKAGAATPAGRNANTFNDWYYLRKELGIKNPRGW